LLGWSRRWCPPSFLDMRHAAEARVGHDLAAERVEALRSSLRGRSRAPEPAELPAVAVGGGAAAARAGRRRGEVNLSAGERSFSLVGFSSCAGRHKSWARRRIRLWWLPCGGKSKRRSFGSAAVPLRRLGSGPSSISPPAASSGAPTLRRCLSLPSGGARHEVVGGSTNGNHGGPGHELAEPPQSLWI
jgi:hypothetical protein